MAMWHRWAWLMILGIGVGLYLLVLNTLVDTRNPNFVPALVLLGAAVVPITFLVFVGGRSGRWRVPAPVLALVTFFGGVVGVVAAGRLEYDALRDLGVLPMLFVALIEESAKLIVPALLLVVLSLRRLRRDPADGLVIGVASGAGFAALETMGYAFTALLSSGGNIGAVEQTLFLRGLMAPAGHTAWTGLTCGALWALAHHPTGRRWLAFIATFAGAVLLHAIWDTAGTTWVYLILAAVSLGWLAIQQRRYRIIDDRLERGTVSTSP